MDYVPHVDLSFSAGNSATVLTYIGYHDQLLLNLSAIASSFASSPVYFTLNGTHDSALSARTAYYFDYVCQSPAACVITASTAGVYELPFPGGLPYVQISFDTAATQNGILSIVYPSID